MAGRGDRRRLEVDPPRARRHQGPKRPTGSFIFLGPSGVGKTELARRLAEFLFGDEDALIQVDMSSTWRSTPCLACRLASGYVGYDEGGQLAEAVRRKPYSVVLLDEIEKAPGRLQHPAADPRGRGSPTRSGRRSTSEHVVIMTSNIGAAQISKNQTLGFSIGDEQGLSTR